MASKKRGGLSSREFAAQKAQQVKQVQKKPVSRPLSNTMDTEGYTRDIYNALPANSPAKVSAAQNPGGFAELAKKASASKQREQAAKAQKNTQKPSISGNSLLGIPTARAASTPDYNQASLQTTMNVPKGTAGSIFNKGADWLRQSAPLGISGLLQTLNQKGIDLSALSGTDELFGLKTPGLAEYRTADNKYIADQQGMADFGQLRQQDPTADANDYMQRRVNQAEQRESGNLAPWASSFVPTAVASTGENNNQRKNDFDPSFMGNGEGDANLPQYQQPDYSQQQNEMYDGGQAPVDQASPRVTNQMRGSGLFGTGKGVGNPAGDDQYIKELRKAYASNGGEKWLRQQFDELIKALDPTYAQMQTEGTNALNENLRNQNNQLASVMNAGNVGDSEQRAQMMAQQQSGTQTAIGALLAKLAQGKAQDVSGYKSQMAQGMSQLKEKNQTNQQRLMEQIQQYQGQRGQQASGATRGAQPTKISRNDVFNWAEDALNKGYSWAEIAENAKEQGIGTETGGYLDQLLNKANKQNRYR